MPKPAIIASITRNGRQWRGSVGNDRWPLPSAATARLVFSNNICAYRDEVGLGSAKLTEPCTNTAARR